MNMRGLQGFIDVLLLRARQSQPACFTAHWEKITKSKITNISCPNLYNYKHFRFVFCIQHWRVEITQTWWSKKKQDRKSHWIHLNFFQLIFARFSENKKQAQTLTRGLGGSYHYKRKWNVKLVLLHKKAFIIGLKSVFKQTETNGPTHDMFLHWSPSNPSSHPAN